MQGLYHEILEIWTELLTSVHKKQGLSISRNYMNTHPALLSHNLISQIIGQDSAILPDGFNCLAKLKICIDQNCLKILKKLRKVMKIEKMLLIKPVSDYFSEILGTFSDKSRKF